MSLQLLLFIDDRPCYRDNIQQIKNYLQTLRRDFFFELQIIEIGKQPDLVEHFRLVATPALVKLSPEPRQILAGSDLIAQIKKWWGYWQSNPTVTQDIVNNSAQPKLTLESSLVEGIDSISQSTELLRLSDEIFCLKQEKEELVEQLRFKDHVLAMLAHDLRSPLTAISIALETLEIIENQPEQQKRNPHLKQQVYKQAKKQFRIMNRMITDILQASKSMSAKLQIKPHPLYLQSICQEVLDEFNSICQEKSQTLTADLPQDLPLVYADQELIRQVIVNLLDNAVKYTPSGGKILLSILHRTTQSIQVTVSDTGLGIPKEKQEEIFQGHFRLQRDEQQQGYGIGLFLCRQVVDAHHGHIWVDSVPNQGSSFNFTLPVYTN